jgi:hypothetical protein
MLPIGYRQELPDARGDGAQDIHEATLPGQQGNRKRGRASTGKDGDDVAGQAMDIDSDGPTIVRDDTPAAPNP